MKGLHNEFAESLHHRSRIVQVPELKGRRRNDLEILLSIFDQANRMSDHHILNLNAERFPDEYRTVPSSAVCSRPPPTLSASYPPPAI
ncbi:MAG: hypothetical protein LBG28_01385 [Tannerella sp.]|nr:hypothetical protein [Tannerella sp.]